MSPAKKTTPAKNRKTPDAANPAPSAAPLVYKIIFFVLALILFLSLWPWGSYDGGDFDKMLGGSSSTPVLSNWIGRLGVCLSHEILLLVGFGAYLFSGALLLSATRRLFGSKGIRQPKLDYWLALFFLPIGGAILFGAWPDIFPNFTAKINLAGIPGGVVGQLFAEPGTGLLQLVMSLPGTIIFASGLIACCLAFLWVNDFHGILGEWKQKLQQKKEEDSIAAAAEEITPKKKVKPSQPELLPQEAQDRRELEALGKHYEEEVTPAPPVAKQKTTPAPEKKAPQKANVPAHVVRTDFRIPGLDLLEPDNGITTTADPKEVQKNREILQGTLNVFGVDGKVIRVTSGPRVTLFEVLLEPGVKVEKVSNIQRNIRMELSALSLRILTPIPGKNTVGIEVPNKTPAIVTMRNLLESKEWKGTRGQLPVLLGRGISGDVVLLDLAKAPHLLIAGATGSGKSVCINLIIMSLLYRFSPEELQLILVDPKVVEFRCYESLPHLITPVISDVGKVPLALGWIIREMKHRYEMLAIAGVRNLASYNRRNPKETLYDEDGNELPARLPFMVVIIDELADVMMSAKNEVENSLARIAQMSRAVGIHVIVATQRPSVNVITGVIKANIPVRIAFKVTSHIDSRTIIDGKGAEALLGQGDMLFAPPGASALERNQGGLVSDHEIERVVDFWAQQGGQNFVENIFTSADEFDPDAAMEGDSFGNTEFENVGVLDELGIPSSSEVSQAEEQLVQQAIAVLKRDKRATTSYIQRALRIGYNRAATIMSILEQRGIVGPQVGQRPRDILILDRNENSNYGNDSGFDDEEPLES